MSKKKIALFSALALLLSSYQFANAAPQKFKFKVEGECADSAMEGTIEEDVTGNCKIVVTINPAKPFRVVNLQYKDEDGKWQFANDEYNEKISVKSDANKKVYITVPQYDEDGVFFDFPKREYRVYMGKIGTAPGVASKTITINYVQAGGDGEDVNEEP